MGELMQAGAGFRVGLLMRSRYWLPQLLACILGALACPLAGAAAPHDRDISGTVTSSHGKEAGVWVLAETTDMPTRFTKIVVTDDQGRYLVPDLPKANYHLWVRGYGLVDSKPVDAVPGTRVDLQAALAPDPAAAAQYYPSSYWLTLIDVPAASEFPGTGPSGNGLLPSLKTQQDFLSLVGEGCNYCHQLGSKIVRETPALPGLSTGQAFAARMVKVGSEHPPIQNGDFVRFGGALMSQMMGNLGAMGRERALKMFGQWSDSIAAGAVPAEAPPRPQGLERNVVISEWDAAGGEFIHDVTSSDKRQPTVNGNGPVFGVGNLGGTITILDPVHNSTSTVNVPSLEKPAEVDMLAGLHTDMVDSKGRMWSSSVGAGSGPLSDYCKAGGDASSFGSYYPRDSLPGAMYIAMYDPRTAQVTRIQTCFTTHHLNFASDQDETLYFSGDFEAVGWIKTRVFDETHDWKKSIGWCPFVLDTNGDGKITPDHTQWNELGKQIDPTKDTRISSFPYGMGISPTDGAFWVAKFTPRVPSGIMRVEVGKDPPRTCKTEYYEPPKVNGLYQAFNARGVDVDSKGIAWVAFGSGHIGRFDRSKCKVKSGPTATGQQCPEGWSIYRTPGPSFKNVENSGSTSWHYLTFVDHRNVLGLGKDIPILPTSAGDSLLAFLPDSKKFVEMRIPYPLSAYPRGVDARIDDPNKGWKGRGLWTSTNPAVLKHMENGTGTSARIIHVQLRPDPLAN